MIRAEKIEILEKEKAYMLAHGGYRQAEALTSAIKILKEKSILDKIRAEITAIVINGQVDEHTAFIRTGEQVRQMALDIIDNYKAESEDKE